MVKYNNDRNTFEVDGTHLPIPQGFKIYVGYEYNNDVFYFKILKEVKEGGDTWKYVQVIQRNDTLARVKQKLAICERASNGHRTGYPTVSN